ncbi:MAG: biotin transporter BioY [Desulfovibrio sp.]|nr:MAG: biotin transporter BioY [Desulfovibrio sp.]
MTQSTISTPVAAVHSLAWTACMAALISVGAFLMFPIFAVPFTMQTFFVLLAGFILGPVQGALAIILYIAAGLAGLPVFSGGKSGYLALVGPTGGFFLGFLLAVLATGLASQRGKESAKVKGPVVLFVYGLVALVLLFAPGILWFHQWMEGKLTLWEATAAMGPFFGLDIIKLIGAVTAYRFLVRQRLTPL